MRVLQAVTEVNEARPDEVLRIVRRHVTTLAGTQIAVLGLAFKPDTSDVRDSPAIPIVERLLDEGASVRIHDPVVTELPDRLRRTGVSLTSDLPAVLSGADAVVLVTRWGQYEAELPAALGALDAQPVLIDCRRVIDPDRIARYDGVGLADEGPRRPAASRSATP
jgi:UDPglucose 6-dehydrogenase/GDP-mannose 6-dehydrogenase